MSAVISRSLRSVGRFLSLEAGLRLLHPCVEVDWTMRFSWASPSAGLPTLRNSTYYVDMQSGTETGVSESTAVRRQDIAFSVKVR